MFSPQLLLCAQITVLSLGLTSSAMGIIYWSKRMKQLNIELPKMPPNETNLGVFLYHELITDVSDWWEMRAYAKNELKDQFDGEIPLVNQILFDVNWIIKLLVAIIKIIIIEKLIDIFNRKKPRSLKGPPRC